MDGSERPVIWVGSNRKELRNFPREVRRDLGQALMLPSRVKPIHPRSR